MIKQKRVGKVKKSLFATLLVALFAVVGVALQPEPSYAAVPQDSCFAFSAGTITDYYDNEGNNSANPACPRAVDIPSTIGGIPVTSISTSPGGPPGAFQAKNIVSVTIPNSVVTIGDFAFADNNTLTTVAIGNGVTTIGFNAFAYTLGGSGSLSALTLSSSLQTIGPGAFRDNQITTVTIPNSVTDIGPDAFIRNQISSLTLGSSVISIGGSAFDTNQIASLTIPSSVTTIGDSAFNANQLTSIVIPNSVTSLDVAAFANNLLTSVSISTSLTTIAPTVFMNNQLTSVTIPSTITSIGSYAFYNNRLTTLDIPSSVTAIDVLAFGLNELTSVTINGVPTLGTGVFALNGIVITDYQAAAAAGTAQLQAYWDSHLTFVPVYTADPSNPAGYADEVLHESDFGSDFNNDGDMTDIIGSHIINPARYTVHYKDTNGNTIAPDTLSGTGPTLNDYLVSSNPTGVMTLYYRGGQTVALVAPTISGYRTPPNGSLTLVRGNDNSYTFVYIPLTPSRTPSAPTPTIPTAPDTGASMINPIVFTPLVLIGIAFGIRSTVRRTR